MDVVHEICAGLDVHKKNVMACVRVLGPGGRARAQVRPFGTMTRDIEALAKWLAQEGVTHVAMESTGIYWKPIWNLLEDRFHLLLCNAKHVKQVPGRKTDVKDCEWLAKLLQHGLLQGSFVPPRRQRELRDLTRYRAKLASVKTAEINRLHKVLEDANIKLASVASDVLGASGRAMIQAIIDGVDDPNDLADLARKQLRAKIPALRFALRGGIRDHHRFMLRQHYQEIVHLESTVAELDARIALLTDPGPDDPDAAEPAGPLFETDEPEPSTSRGDPEASPPSHAEAIRLLDSIPGVNRRGAEAILAEIGLDMSRFPTPRHLASWSGVCPGNNESAGVSRRSKPKKGNVWLRRALGLAASGAVRKKDCFLGAKYRRIAKRRGKARAMVAVGHTILLIAHYLLTNRQEYVERGADFYDRIDTERKVRYHLRRLEQLGVTLPADEAA